MTLITIELADAVLAERRRQALGGPRPSPIRRRRRMRRGRLPVT
ncbi:MAG TPA: hypothetical protein VLR27_13905 [Acidimicrobiales bacterium]|jgi:hypothetical protein|nr:hypothetical protein [Acidimicrobiales bacterium]